MSDKREPLWLNPSLYREFQAVREAILKHQVLESQKSGHEVDFEQALTKWVDDHSVAWRKKRRRSL